MDESTIEITVDKYNELIRDQKMLYALYAMGVENWDGHDEALESMNYED